MTDLRRRNSAAQSLRARPATRQADLALAFRRRPETVELLRGARHPPEIGLRGVDPVDHVLVVRKHIPSRPQGLEIETRGCIDRRRPRSLLHVPCTGNRRPSRVSLVVSCVFAKAVRRPAMQIAIVGILDAVDHAIGDATFSLSKPTMKPAMTNIPAGRSCECCCRGFGACSASSAWHERIVVRAFDADEHDEEVRLAHQQPAGHHRRQG